MMRAFNVSTPISYGLFCSIQLNPDRHIFPFFFSLLSFFPRENPPSHFPEKITNTTQEQQDSIDDLLTVTPLEDEDDDEVDPSWSKI